MFCDFLNQSSLKFLISEELEKLTFIFPKSIYAYAIINKKNLLDITIFSNQPKWFDFYISEEYQLTDPVVLKGLRSISDFSWGKGETEIENPKLKKVFSIAEENKIEIGHTFVLHDYRDNAASISVMTQENFRDEFIKTIEKEKQDIASLLVKIHQKTLFLYDNFYDKSSIIDLHFSEKENRVLSLLGEGKTYEEISKILGTTKSSVKAHIKKITKKLGAIDEKQAIYIAKELNLISI